MGIVEAVEIALTLGTLVALIALVFEVRRGRRVGEEIRTAIEQASDVQRADRAELFTRATIVLRAALDDGQRRAIVFDPAQANDTTPEDEPSDPAGPSKR